MQVRLVAAFLLLTFAVGLSLALAASTGQTNSEAAMCSKEKFTSIQDCATCCAIGGHNKFDRQAFLADERRECRCYTDEKELKLNQTPGRRAAMKKPSN